MTDSASEDLEVLRQKSATLFDAAIYIEPESGTRERAISSDSDATTLAIHANVKKIQDIFEL